MGHYAEIWIRPHQNPDYREGDIFLSVKYSLPLFWLALFEPKHIVKLKDEDDLDYYIFRAPLKECCRVFAERGSIWKLLYEDEKVERLAEAFLQYLFTQLEGIVDLNINDLIGMYMDYTSVDAKTEMINMIAFIESLKEKRNNHPHGLRLLQRDFHLISPENRYLELDGFGKEIIPCKEIDDYLEKQARINSEKYDLSDQVEKHKYEQNFLILIWMKVKLFFNKLK